jgi:hypothetical protein
MRPKPQVCGQDVLSYAAQHGCASAVVGALLRYVPLPPRDLDARGPFLGPFLGPKKHPLLQFLAGNTAWAQVA